MNPKFIKEYAAKMGREQNRRVKQEEAEQEVIDILQRVAKAVAPSFTFGYLSRADLEQEGICAGLEVLRDGKYDISRPLENFMYTHIHNRLFNYKRKHFMRSERPCKCCDPFDPPNDPCQKFISWSKRNLSKQHVMSPLDVGSVSDENESSMRHESEVETEAWINEYISLIDERLPVYLRSDYLKMKSGITLPKDRQHAVETAIKDIVRLGEECDGSY